MPDRARLFRIAPGEKLVLASASPRRQEFLRGLGLEFEIAPAPDEQRRGANARERASLAAKAKAEHCARLFAGCSVIGADTAVELNGAILGKPANPAQALRMLLALNGQACSVCSAVLLILPTGKQEEITDTATVVFAHWPEEVLAAYARDDEPQDKAGAFAIQGRGSFLIDRIEGSFTTVMGLPGAKLVRALLRNGIIRPVA